MGFRLANGCWYLEDTISPEWDLSDINSLFDEILALWSLTYIFIFYISDVRTQNWFMVSSPIPTIIIVMAYLAFVHKGLRWMKRREAYDLKLVLQIYNFCLVLLNAYIFYEVCFSTHLMYSSHYLDICIEWY